MPQGIEDGCIAVICGATWISFAGHSPASGATNAQLTCAPHCQMR